MSAFFGWRPRVGRDEPDENARDLWTRRDAAYGPREEGAYQSGDGRRWIARIAARVGFESFERVFFVMVGGVVLAGSVVIIGASLTGPAVDESAPPSIIIAKQEPTQLAVEPAKVAVPPSRASASTSPAMSIAPVPSPLSQTPVRESARDALTMARPAMEPAPEQHAVATHTDNSALGYAAEAAAEPASEGATETESAGAAEQKASVESEEKQALQPDGRVSRCFVKVAGRVLNSGNCRISRKGQTVTLAYGGGGVSVSPSKGREWSLMLAGRNVGRVYKSGSCWGSNNHTWICEKGV